MATGGAGTGAATTSPRAAVTRLATVPAGMAAAVIELLCELRTVLDALGVGAEARISEQVVSSERAAELLDDAGAELLAFTAFSAYAVYFSQEMLPYAMLMFIAAMHNGVSRLYETFGNGGADRRAPIVRRSDPRHL